MKITSHIKFDLQFDAAKLQQDLSLLLENSWIPHFNKSNYEGEWQAIPLYAPNGDEKNIFAFGNDEPLKPTPLLKQCPYVDEVISSFKCQILSARILKLGVGAVIKPHRDYELGYEDNNFRIHIPIITNDKVNFVLDNERLTMLPGECWYTNVNYVHSVTNEGDTPRIHLVIDGARNDWSDQLFFSMVPEESLVHHNEGEMSFEDLKRTIEELKRNGFGSAELIKDLEEKLLKAK
ncbi:Aspartyl/Asparaginyl beta-hydroxylase [Spirosomataceae bacterium TFI 002]|nr:Aspartyl/Asparaginyl beta-hydroxylase [Spirosomataceae bacterium TFI 002]